MSNEIKPERVTVLMEPELLKRIELFQHANLVRARSDAVFALIECGLANSAESAQMIKTRPRAARLKDKPEREK